MKEQVTFCDFQDRFRDYGRQDQFSYAGLKALFEYLEEYEEDTGMEIELDVIALCCEYTELDIEDYIDQYMYDDAEVMLMDTEDKREAALSHAQDRTSVIIVDDDTIIIQAY